MKRPAPYAADVCAELEAGRFPALHIFAGPDAWQRAEHRRRTHGPGTALVLPAAERPETFDWPPIAPEALVITGMPSRDRASLETRLRAACTRTG